LELGLTNSWLLNPWVLGFNNQHETGRYYPQFNRMAQSWNTNSENQKNDQFAPIKEDSTLQKVTIFTQVCVFMAALTVIMRRLIFISFFIPNRSKVKRIYRGCPEIQ